MHFIKKCLILTPFLLLLLQVTITYAFFGSFFDSNRRPRDRTTPSTTVQQPTANNNTSYSTNVSDSYNTNLTIDNSTNITASVNTSSRSLVDLTNYEDEDEDEYEDEDEEYYDDISDDRRKRDIRSDIFENELQMAARTYSSQISSLSKNALNSITSQIRTLNQMLNWFNLSDKTLATNGLNDLSSIANKIPASIQNCYNSYGFTFSDAINVAQNKASECLSNKINEAKSIKQDFQNSIANAFVNVKDVSKQMTECKMLANLYPNVAGIIAKASCLTSAILSIRSETALLPLKVATLAGQAFNEITTIQSDMNKCGLEIVNTILDQSIQSGKAINNCVDQQNATTTSAPTSQVG